MTKSLVAMLGCAVVVVAVSLSARSQPAAPQRGGTGRGAGTAEAAPPAPPPGSAGIYKAGSDLTAVLKKAIAAAPDMATSAVANTDGYRINVVHRGKSAGAIAHPGNTELHYIIDGAATFVSGGTIVRPAAGSSAVAS